MVNDSVAGGGVVGNGDGIYHWIQEPANIQQNLGGAADLGRGDECKPGMGLYVPRLYKRSGQGEGSDLPAIGLVNCLALPVEGAAQLGNGEQCTQQGIPEIL